MSVWCSIAPRLYLTAMEKSHHSCEIKFELTSNSFI